MQIGHPHQGGLDAPLPGHACSSPSPPPRAPLHPSSGPGSDIGCEIGHACQGGRMLLSQDNASSSPSPPQRAPLHPSSGPGSDMWMRDWPCCARVEGCSSLQDTLAHLHHHHNERLCNPSSGPVPIVDARFGHACQGGRMRLSRTRFLISITTTKSASCILPSGPGSNMWDARLAMLVKVSWIASSPRTRFLISIHHHLERLCILPRPWFRYVDARLAMLVKVEGCSSPRTCLLISITHHIERLCCILPPAPFKIYKCNTSATNLPPSLYERPRNPSSHPAFHCTKSWSLLFATQNHQAFSETLMPFQIFLPRCPHDVDWSKSVTWFSQVS
ncbi:hypothetical protein B0H14DRAFT_3041663 [Mycena olivaceomarginata]|nr:hypothetical protein B0H14DRAFT_3041663 [Mycena olivaceomarginata]